MIKLHHLNRSRSHRIFWLLEEIGVDYEVAHYQRDEITNLAPPELLHVHPLGKSPMIEIDGRLVTESAAITEVLCQRFAPHHVVLEPGQTILSGSFTRTVPVTAGDNVRADFGPPGEINVDFV